LACVVWRGNFPVGLGVTSVFDFLAGGRSASCLLAGAIDRSRLRVGPSDRLVPLSITVCAGTGTFRSGRAANFAAYFGYITS
jgi:hypothetical protein